MGFPPKFPTVVFQFFAVVGVAAHLRSLRARPAGRNNHAQVLEGLESPIRNIF